MQLADTFDRGDGERHILVAYILVLVLQIYSCTISAYTNTPDTVMAGAKLADLEMQEKKTKALRKTAQQRNKCTRKTGKMAGESRKEKPAQKEKKKVKTAGTMVGKTTKAGKKKKKEKEKKPKRKTANESLSSEAMELSKRRAGGAARKAVEDVSHAWCC